MPGTEAWRAYFEFLWEEYSIPVIMTAGNTPKDYDGDELFPIDTAPQVLEDVDTPLINVGASNFAGIHSKSFKTGPQLTIYAPGENSEAQRRENGETDGVTGTSIAAPAVAGLVATYLNYDPLPWDATKTGIARVQAIKDYLQKDASSWSRNPNGGPSKDIRVIWNGATKEVHKSAGADVCAIPSSKLKRQDECGTTPNPPPEEPSKPTCWGFGPDKNFYVYRDHVSSILSDTFCPDAAGQKGFDGGSQRIARTYNKGTPEEINVAMDWKPEVSFLPDLEKCKNFMAKITDGCDPDQASWKAGGELRDGDVNYQWNVVNSRSPFEEGKAWGGCDGSADWFSTKYTIWGSKFAGDDYGKAIIEGIQGKGVSPSKWVFNYGGADDHREWTASVNVIAGAEYAVEPVMEGVGSIDIECS